MNQPMNLHKASKLWGDALWWKPIFALQRQASRDWQRVLPEQLLPLWNSGDGFLLTMQNATHNVFCQMFNNRQMIMPWFMGHPTEPYINITETDESFQVKADLPGVCPDKLDISIADSALIIKSGERQCAPPKKGSNYIRRECCEEPFTRTIALPMEADIDKAMATFDKNVLTIDVPRKSMPIVRKLIINQPPEIPESVRITQMETRIAQVLR